MLLSLAIVTSVREAASIPNSFGPTGDVVELGVLGVAVNAACFRLVTSSGENQTYAAASKPFGKGLSRQQNSFVLCVKAFIDSPQARRKR